MAMEVSSKAAQNERQWSQRIKDQASSGQSVAAFCKERGLSVASLYGWRTQLGKSSAVMVAKARSVVPFIDLGAVREPSPVPIAAMAGSGVNVHLDLGGGMTLTITRR